MGEWLKPTDLKSVKAARSSGVRIPLPPPYNNYYSDNPSNNNFCKNPSRSTLVPLRGKKLGKAGERQEEIKAIVC